MPLTTEVPRRERIVDDIMDLVLDGGIQPDVPTSESKIAAMLPSQPSRTPVREALALMVRDGMFDQIPQSGVRLRPVVPEEIDELMQLRRPLEVLIVNRLCLQPEVPSLTELEQRIDETRRAIDLDMKAFTRADLGFHCGLAKVAGMRAAEVSLRNWIGRLRLFGAQRDLDVPSAFNELETQSAIKSAIERHDRKNAEMLVNESLNLAERRFGIRTPGNNMVAMPARAAALAGA